MAQSSPKAAVFSGASVSHNSWFAYTGTVVGLGTTLDKSGFLARVFAGYGKFDYATTGVAGGSVDGSATKVDLSPGYQFVLPLGTLSVYAGADYVDTSLSPGDPLNSTAGAKWGAFGQGEFATNASVPFFFGAIGKYSSANDEYWTRTRLGGRLQGLTIGPEFIAAGNVEYDEKRVGGFVSGIKIADLSVDLSAGYAWSNARDEGERSKSSGAYGGIALYFPF